MTEVDKDTIVTELSAIQGCLLGTAVGDSLGLPFEGMTPKRISKLKPLPLKQRFFFGRGMISDDTEHTCFVMQALIESGGKVEIFRSRLARRLRWWLLGLPAGIGLATLRSIIKMWLGIKPMSSGVWSAGNGPAMRSAIIGVFAGANSELLSSLVSASTSITHRDPKALRGACVVAKAAQLNAAGVCIQPGQCFEHFSSFIENDETLVELIGQAEASAKDNESAAVFSQNLGLQKGVTGYIYHTLPVVLQIWLRYPRDYRKAMEEVIVCGGDTDTVAAIVGGIVGAGVGLEGIPSAWLNQLNDWPRSKQWMLSLSSQLHTVMKNKQTVSALGIPIIGQLVRNVLFMLWVLLHGFRRLLPPYG